MTKKRSADEITLSEALRQKVIRIEEIEKHQVIQESAQDN